MLNCQWIAKIPKFFSSEHGPVVTEDSIGNPEAAKDFI